jgi:hypothetical protein
MGGGWRPEFYTMEGVEWLQNSGMADVLQRHFPESEPPKGVKNALAPEEKWKKVGKAGK